MKPRSTKIYIVVAVILALFTLAGGVFAAEREQVAQFVAPKLVVNTSFLNVRTGPGVQYSVLVTVVGGTELPVLGVANDGVWYQVSTVLGIGWVNLEFTLPRGDFGVVPLAEAPPITQGLVIQDPALLGQGGGGGAPLFSTTTTTTVTTRQNSPRPWGVSVLGGDLHSAPTTTSTKLVQAMGEDRLTIYPMLNATFAEGTPWYQIAFPSGPSGWLQAQFSFVRPLNCTPSVGSVAIMTHDSGLQSGFGVVAPAYGVTGGQEVYIADIRDGLVRIELIDGATGFVSLDATIGRDDSKLVKICTGVPVTGTLGTTPVTTGAGLAVPHVVINTAFLNIRSGPSAQFTVVATVPGGTELPVIGITNDSVWYLLQGSFGQGWVNSEFVLFRGDIGNVPIIRNAVGTLATPIATVNGVVTLFAAPNATLGSVGSISGPIQVAVVARTSDFAWVQINTPIGFGWVPASQVTLSGDTAIIPIVQ